MRHHQFATTIQADGMFFSVMFMLSSLSSSSSFTFIVCYGSYFEIAGLFFRCFCFFLFRLIALFLAACESILSHIPCTQVQIDSKFREEKMPEDERDCSANCFDWVDIYYESIMSLGICLRPKLTFKVHLKVFISHFIRMPQKGRFNSQKDNSNHFL